MVELEIKLKNIESQGGVFQGTDLIHTLPMLSFLFKYYNWDLTPLKITQ